MKKAVVVAALVILTFACGLARGDGMLIIPDSLSALFSEQMQEAVVAVKPDKTVEVDLFISLLDKSGKEHEVPFLLPLQTMPGDFGVDEVDRREFGGARLDPLYRLVRRANLDRAAAKRRAVRSYSVCSLMCGALSGGLGSCGLLVYPLLRSRAAHFGGGSVPPNGLAAVQPTLSVTTEHARVDVYRALRHEQLAALAKMPRLPSSIASALKRYAGRPFALVRLRTIGQPPHMVTERVAPGHLRSWYPHPGVHLHFTQKMLRKSRVAGYDYPLGTGQGWRNPIAATRVWVTARDTLRLGVDFPRGYRERFTEALDGTQVDVATYENARPNRDVRIRLLGTGWSLSAINEVKGRAWAWMIWLVFPLLAAIVWLAAFRLVVWRHPVARTRGFWRGALKSWGAQALVLAVLFWPGLAMLAVGILYGFWHPSDYLLMREGVLPGIPGLAFLIVSVGTLVWLISVATREVRGFVWRSALASVIAAALYAGVGWVWLLRL